MPAIAVAAHTPLHDWHAANGGRMVDFAGWSMPIQYGSIVEEHQATRTAVGLFDISHMGRTLISGLDAGKLLESLLTRRIGDLKPGQVRYSLVCNESGGVLDDVLAYRVEVPANDLLGYGLVINASNRDKIDAHLRGHASGHDVAIEDVSDKYAMIAVQGPKAIELLDPVTDCELTSFRYYTGEMSSFTAQGIEPVECYVSRTGYTGEDGCEIICPADRAVDVWQALIDMAMPIGGGPVGLAARDTLRLEAGMPLYGHELTEDINPIAAGLSFAVNLKDREFVGREALVAARKDSQQSIRIGLQLDGRRPAREGATVLQGDQPVGTVTSGTFSPTFDRPLAMAYVKPSAAGIGEHLAVDIRGKVVGATVAPLPFYQRGK
ncbi:MAG: glycine cleavage system aminomethyltransferase GcvT [Planctomycetota bacterium]